MNFIMLLLSVHKVFRNIGKAGIEQGEPLSLNLMSIIISNLELRNTYNFARP